MTSYMETANVAHVMRWNGSLRRHEAVCRVHLTVKPDDYQDHPGLWPLRFESVHVRDATAPPRTKPWCRWCVRAVVADLAPVVFDLGGVAGDEVFGVLSGVLRDDATAWDTTVAVLNALRRQ